MCLSCVLADATGGTSVDGQVQQRSGAGDSSLSVQAAGQQQRVLLVGASSKGSVAVWDVGRRQQIVAVHCPDMRLSGLLAPTALTAQAAAAAAFRAAQAAAAAGDVAAAAAGCTQQPSGGGRQPVVCLAAVRSIDSSSGASQQQQGPQQLRALVLHEGGQIQVGAPLLAAGRQGGVCAAALAGSTVAAATAAGVLKVWDVSTGQRLMGLKPAPAGTDALSSTGVSTVAVMSSVGDGQLHSTLVLAGSASGVLTAAVL
jgi:hypothetical protein